MSLKKKVVIALAATAVAAGSFTVPAMAQQQRSFDPARLDKAPAEYTQYRRYYRGGHWRGGSARGAAIAGAVGLGILGVAAAAANSRAYYSDPYYDDYYAPAPVYAPRAYYRPYGYYGPYDFRDYR